MRIYIDEAGNFLPPTAKPHLFSLVLALVIPSEQEAGLFYGFLRLRDLWRKQEIEIKGSALDENECAQVLELLGQFDVFVEFFAVDMATHRDEVLTPFKNQQADRLMASVTPEHHPNIVRAMNELSSSVREMPNQLFAQAFLTIRLILALMQEVTFYYVQRSPKELGEIAWFVDRKNRSITSMEKTWTTLILPITEHEYAKNPLGVLKGADYSYFSRYEQDVTDSESAQHLKWLEETYGLPKRVSNERVIDIRRFLTDGLQFENSRESLGLQLADIIATTLRRALNDHLGKSGWKGLGKLMVNRTASRFIQLGDREGPAYLSNHAEQVWETLREGFKAMFLDDD